ncbi:MAG: HIT domain-containing protein [Terriglobales bacterium]
MDHLFSPWRYQYIREPRVGSAGCVLCHELSQGDDAASLVVFRARYCAIVLNRFPYTTGHIMILPFAHCATLAACGVATRAEMFELAARAEIVLQTEYQPQGLNVGLNLGEAAGAGIAGHIHLHVVPRWRGDANFMTIVSETRVLPEALADTYARLHRAFALSPTPGAPDAPH